MGLTLGIRRSPNSFCNHIASCAHEDNATYSASAVLNAQQVCLVERQEMAALPYMKQYPDVDSRLLLSPAKSASEYPTTQGSKFFGVAQTEIDCAFQISENTLNGLPMNFSRFGAVFGNIRNCKTNVASCTS